MIPRELWQWCGYPGHFIAAHKCRFHLHTRVGDYRISTVGHYIIKGRIERVGAGRTFETMVFFVEPDHSPEGSVPAWSQPMEMVAYNDSRDAEAGHYAACEKYAAMQGHDVAAWDAEALRRHAQAQPSPRAAGEVWEWHIKEDREA